MTPRRADYDAAWKYLADHYLDELIDYTFPDFHALIDWQQPVIVRDSELAELGIDANEKLRADKLIELTTGSGTPLTVLLHLEFQSQPEQDFAQRMFRYACAIYARYQRPFAVLVVLADRNRRWRPSTYDAGFGGATFTLHYPIYKLLDRPLREVEQDPRLAAFLDQMVRLSWSVRGDEARLAVGSTLIRRFLRNHPHPDRIRDLLRLFQQVLRISKQRRSELYQLTQQILREEKIMLEHRVLAGFEEDAEERGEARGRRIGKEIGKEIGQREVVLRLLARRIGMLSDADTAALAALPAARLPDLAEALLDFSSRADLLDWLARH